MLHVVEGDPNTTIVADLTNAYNIDTDTFDCIICTQTLQMIYDVKAAIRNLYRILKPGGVVLVTSHGISKLSRHEGTDPWGEYWHFTSQSLTKLFQEVFPSEEVLVRAYGNVLSANSFLQGLAAHELRREDLDYCDRDYEVIVTVKATKASDGQ